MNGDHFGEFVCGYWGLKGLRAQNKDIGTTSQMLLTKLKLINCL